jgi:hypothetical protein
VNLFLRESLVEEEAVESEFGYIGADVARYSGVTNACVTRLVASGKSLILMTLLESYERSARTLPLAN